MRESTDVLETLELSDFDNHLLRRSYLAVHGIEMWVDCWHRDEGNKDRWDFGFCWKYGFNGMVMPYRYGIEAAEAWTFYFVWHYVRGMKCWDADDKADEIFRTLGYKQKYAYLYEAD